MPAAARTAIYVSFGCETNDRHPTFFIADRVTPLGPVLDLASTLILLLDLDAADSHGVMCGRGDGPKAQFEGPRSFALLQGWGIRSSYGLIVLGLRRASREHDDCSL